jgi:hypothetical protein
VRAIDEPDEFVRSSSGVGGRDERECSFRGKTGLVRVVCLESVLVLNKLFLETILDVCRLSGSSSFSRDILQP